MKPGATTRSAASITVAAPSVTRPISAILPPVMATSARRAGAPVPSTTAPFLITRSWAMKSSLFARGRLLGQPHVVELLVQEVRGCDGPSPDLGAVGDDPVPLQGVDVVGLLVEQPLLEGAQIPLALLGIQGARLLQE